MRASCGGAVRPRRVFARRLSAAATARDARTPARQLLTASPSTWQTSTAGLRARPSLHNPKRLGGLGRVSCRQGPEVCSVRFHDWGRLAGFAVEGPGIALWGGRDHRCKVGRRRCKQGGGERQPGAATQLLSARTLIAKAANCALQSQHTFKYSYKYI